MSIERAAAQIAKMKQFFAILPGTAEALLQWETLVVQHQVSGKKTHDARLVAAMNVHGVSRILTFNGPDFSRNWGITLIEHGALRQLLSD